MEQLAVMALSVQRRRVGEISVVTCSGRIGEGAESAALEAHVTPFLPHEPFIVLNLADVNFLDSSGLGLLVRLLARSRKAGGGLKLCALPPRVSEILKMTRLHATLPSYATEAQAIAAFYDRETSQDVRDLRTDILYVDGSGDVQAYVRALLLEAGYGVMTATNVYDGLILLQAAKPAVVVTSADIRAVRQTGTAKTFHELSERRHLIELEAGFSGADAGEAGKRLLERIGRLLRS